MRVVREQYRSGLDYLNAATALLQRVRHAHPTIGLYEAADLQWWWRTSRSTDRLPQLFWFDCLGRPEAAVIATDWGDGVALAPIVMPDATADWVAHVMERGLAYADECGFGANDLEVDRADDVMREVLIGHGFAVEDDGTAGSSVSLSVVEAWLAADARPQISPLHENYRLCSRLDTMQRPHHMTRAGPDVETRLRQTSLYRPELDLCALDSGDSVAAYGLFWFDPETATGLVEPMRTEDDHQRRGLARHVLTAGIDLLAKAGALRIKLCFKPDNAAASGLYLGVGFEPVKQTVVFSRRDGARAS
ncbi:MAG: GNAT family N-acetyltransferase [Sterolibacteriaceae bacterium]|nr:GNAT family N-acetyltransferase [Candidatus Methylophosphatis haderslevensis]